MENNAIEKCSGMIADGADIDAVLRVLRDSGFSKVQSMKALVDLNQADMADAKTLVHHSAVWKDVRERDEAFHDQMSEEFERSDGKTS